MRAQQLLFLAGFLLAGDVAIAAKVEQDDVPNRCWDACGSVVGISRRCDNQHDNDLVELQCICNWEAAKTKIPFCAACINQYGPRDHDRDHDDDDHDDDGNEALDLVRSCRFSTTTYNAAAATTLSATATGTTDPAAASPTTAEALDQPPALALALLAARLKPRPDLLAVLPLPLRALVRRRAWLPQVLSLYLQSLVSCLLLGCR